MTAIDSVKYLEKHGVKFLMVVAIIWLNDRLSDVESKLENCYEQARIEALRRADTNVKVESMPLLAVLPECKIRRTYERKVKNI